MHSPAEQKVIRPRRGASPEDARRKYEKIQLQHEPKKMQTVLQELDFTISKLEAKSGDQNGGGRDDGAAVTDQGELLDLDAYNHDTYWVDIYRIHWLCKYMWPGGLRLLLRQ